MNAERKINFLVINKNRNTKLFCFFVFAGMASSFKAKISSSETGKKREAILTSTATLTNSREYRELQSQLELAKMDIVAVWKIQIVISICQSKRYPFSCHSLFSSPVRDSC